MRVRLLNFFCFFFSPKIRTRFYGSHGYWFCMFSSLSSFILYPLVVPRVWLLPIWIVHYTICNTRCTCLNCILAFPYVYKLYIVMLPGIRLIDIIMCMRPNVAAIFRTHAMENLKLFNVSRCKLYTDLKYIDRYTHTHSRNTCSLYIRLHYFTLTKRSLCTIIKSTVFAVVWLCVCCVVLCSVLVLFSFIHIYRAHR